MKTLSTKRIAVYTAVLVIAFIIAIAINDMVFKIPELNDKLQYQGKFYPEDDSKVMDFRCVTYYKPKLPIEIHDELILSLLSFNWYVEFKNRNAKNIYNVIIYTGNPVFEEVKQSQFVVVVFTGYAGNNYHSATGRLSLFDFEKIENTWKLSHNHLAFGHGDEYGLEPRNIELAQIGTNNKYALIIHTGYSNMGHDRETKTVYAQVDSLFLPVFDFTCYEYYFNPPEDFEYDEGRFDMRIINTGKTWFDIETKPEFSEWEDGGLRIFKFDRNKYIEK